MKSAIPETGDGKENRNPMENGESEEAARDKPDVLDEDTMSSSSSSSSTEKATDNAVNEALLEKLKNYVESSRLQEHGDTVRTTTAKLYARLTSSDRRIRRRTLETLCRKNSRAMEILIAVLENCKDQVAICSTLRILHECVSPRYTARSSKQRSTGKAGKTVAKGIGRATLNRIIGLGIVQALVRLLAGVQHPVETVAGEILAQEAIWMLSQVAQRDQRFASKMKLLNSIKPLHTMLKQQYSNNKTLLPLLLIVKTLAKNSTTAQALLKDGIAATLERTLVSVGYTPHSKLRTLLECLKYLTANRAHCGKFIKAGIGHSLMKIFERWDRFDGQMRRKICNYALSTLHHLCGIKAGRRVVKSNNGLQLLHRFCVNCPEDRAYDSLLSRVCGIINQCLEKKVLPVPEISPARFALPEAGAGSNSAESGSDADSQVNSVASLGELSQSDLESVDEDGDENEEDRNERSGGVGRKRAASLTGEGEERKFFTGVFSSRRSEEDLVGYSRFFKELGSSGSQVDASKSPIGQGERITVKQRETGRRKEAPENCEESIKIFENVSSQCTDEEVYRSIAGRVKSVISFVKVAYPDLIGGDGQGKAEPLNTKDRRVCRSKLLTCIERALSSSGTTGTQQVAYNLDSLADAVPAREEPTQTIPFSSEERRRTGKRGAGNQTLRFESRFESGNLRKAIQIGPREYDLILSPDVNSGSRHQWFYFEVSNMEADVPYTFNIVNCEKANSQFNFGMKPILFSVTEAQLGRPGWIRTGADICYYRNCYQRSSKGKNYLTTSFTVNFPHANDFCYLAYHFPYTYTQLMSNIWKWKERATPSTVYFHAETLCYTLNGNENPLLTITAPDSKANPVGNRKLVFLTSRVHPGESNASWVMHGTLEALLSDSAYAVSLREDYVFKIIPMLNIEGVVNGCNRYGLTNEDLNRRWSDPSKTLHPVIYHTKGLMEYCTRVLEKPPYVFVDYHGHSRRKNVFLFGCSSSGSWSAVDRRRVDQPAQYLMLPYLMQKTSPAFALALCSFKVERNKESTARVAVWRQLGVPRSYTMESSFCGCDQGILAGLHLDTGHLKAIGRDFCQALSMMASDDQPEHWNLEAFPRRGTTPEESDSAENEITSGCESEDEREV